MAHFVELDDNNVVLRVIVVNNEELLDTDGVEQEERGITFCENLLGGRWIQTSYNGSFRKNYAGAGFTYDEDRNAFISQPPYPSWILNEETCRWEAPIPYPSGSNMLHVWNEETLSWVESQL